MHVAGNIHYGAKPLAMCVFLRAGASLHLSEIVNVECAACIAVCGAFHVTEEMESLNQVTNQGCISFHLLHISSQWHC